MQCRAVLLAAGFNEGRATKGRDLQGQRHDAEAAAATQADGYERRAERLVPVHHGLDEDDSLVFLNIDEAAFYADVGVALCVAADHIATSGKEGHSIHPGRAVLRKAAPARPAFIVCPGGKDP